MIKKQTYYDEVAGYPTAIEVLSENPQFSAREASEQVHILIEEARKVIKFANDAAVATNKAMESIKGITSDAKDAVEDADKAIESAKEAIIKANSAAEKVKTPYEIAIVNGFVGTEKEWLFSLKGSKVTMIKETQTTKQIQSNEFYVWGSVASLTITLAPELPNILNEYMFQFTSGATATTLILPVTVILPDGLSIEPDKTYQISIVNRLLTYGGWDNE